MSETPPSPVKRSSRTPKLSAKMIALEEEVSHKKMRKSLEPKASPAAVIIGGSAVSSAPTTPKVAKIKAPSQAASRKPRKSPSKPKHSPVVVHKVQQPRLVDPELMDGVMPSLASESLYEDNELDITQFTDSGNLVVDEANETTSSLMTFSSNASLTGAPPAAVTGLASLAAAVATGGKEKKKKPHPPGGKKANSDDEAEEKWLQALENGKLEELDSELKSIKDPRLMTARQRAVIEAKQARVEQMRHFQAMQEALRDQQAAEQLSEEVLEKKAQKAAKRKQLAEEKRDKEKKDTIKRLLKKADSRQKLKKLQKQKAQLVGKVHYRFTYDGITVSFPAETPPELLGIDLTPKVARYPTPVMCSNPGCTQLKKYQCSSNGLPVCSLQCYRQVAVLPPLAQLLEAAGETVVGTS